MSTNNINFWELIQFFNNIEVVENVEGEDKENGILCVKVTYKFKNDDKKEYTTANLYYKDISKVDNVKDEKKVSDFFGKPVYWLKCSKDNKNDDKWHDWPSDSPDINEIINEISDNNEEFKEFLQTLYEKIEEITHEGRSARYKTNLVTNNHWHDIVKLIQYFIEKRGDVDLSSNEAKEYFKRMVFEWDDNSGKRTSLHPEFGGRKMIDDLLKNIKNTFMKMEKIEEIKKILEYKKQIILQGAPGTGKTYLAKQIAEELTSKNNEQWKIIQFHPSYNYEDFVRGIVTETKDNNIHYKVTNKILAEFAKKAKENKDKKYVLILDEINRSNLPAVFGELIYALEYRNEPVESLYEHPEEGREIVLPNNLYIIGTMNTTDRSIGHIDYAIRRRFAFYTLTSDKNVISNYYEVDELKNIAINIYNEVEVLVKNHLSPDYLLEDVMIGHSYFLANNKEELKIKLNYEIKPLLIEYYKDGILVDKKEEKVNDKIEKLTLNSNKNSNEN